MASGFFALFDDIATLMDDVAAMSKITTRKTAGLLADDLAVNAEKASGFVAARELPILWEITKGSLLNKIIILPVAFLLSAYLPVAIIPILMIGGLYLAYEGVEKIYSYFFVHKSAKKAGLTDKQSKDEIIGYEKKKIKSAILVDFILSIEIIIIALSTVVEESISIQIIVVSLIALLATVGVYGLVALLVRIDDLGYKLIEGSNSSDSFSAKSGRILVTALPRIIKTLTVLGTLAMILVAGGIYVHNWHFMHESLDFMPSIVAEFSVGLVIGSLATIVVKLYQKIRK